MNGTLYAGTGGIGVYKYDAAAGTWRPVGSKLSSAYIDSMTSMNGVLYVGTDGNGAFAYMTSGWTRIGKTANLSGNATDSTNRVDAMGDINGVLYAGTYGQNVYKYQGGNWSPVGNSLGRGFGADFGITSLLVINSSAGGNTLYAADGASGVYSIPVQPPIALNLSHKNVTQTGWYEYWPAVNGASTYNLYIDGKEVATGLNSPSYTVTGEQPNTTYQVQVTAVNAGGESIKSAADTVKTLPAPPSVPAVPSAPLNLNHKNVTQTGWYEYWPAVNGASTYNLYIDGKEVATGLHNPNYTVTGEQPSTTYQVQVTAVNASGESIKSAVDNVTTLNNQQVVPAATKPVTGFPALPWVTGGFLSVVLGGWVLWWTRRHVE
ncbi:fibronectin type III domain-containing protein [Alicyclobacillus sp. SO9]|uniref:fibronectin type III domain-containing protein n=1 Tax=Alicyclobacillus sp. SO9 TaxID=2665646 RepID=UPI0018E75EA3|nr:fibronectin type III domain-containing protein [Alicyclobacillus sp. SO9]QQE79013.1 fibronectin type III domain-containing protein [Alicyclobacillus sp. SO9]